MEAQTLEARYIDAKKLKAKLTALFGTQYNIKTIV